VGRRIFGYRLKYTSSVETNTFSTTSKQILTKENEYIKDIRYCVITVDERFVRDPTPEKFIMEKKMREFEGLQKNVSGG